MPRHRTAASEECRGSVPRHQDLDRGTVPRHKTAEWPGRVFDTYARVFDDSTRYGRILDFFFAYIYLSCLVEGRFLRLNSSDEDQYLISDGVQEQTSAPKSCNHMYHFLPCAENAAGYIFQIMVYQGLMIFGEIQRDKGSMVLTHILGVGKYGGIIFRILMVLPSIMLMITFRVFSSKENAQSQVSVGVGIYAGITVFSLTVQWGFYVISGRKDLLHKTNGHDTNIWNPWMQQRSLDYANYELLRRGFVEHVQRHGELVNEDGTLNTHCFKKLFSEMDKDADGCITKGGVENLVLKILGTGDMQLIKLFRKSKEETDPQEMNRIKLRILKHAENKLLKAEALIKDDGTPNKERIKTLFRLFDADRDNKISISELENLITTVKFGDFQPKHEDIINELFKDFDKDNNNIIDESEFVEGVEKLINTATQVANSPNRSKSIDLYDGILWNEGYDKWDFIKSVFQVLLGMVMLTLLGGPLMVNILDLSYAMRLPSFCISFVIVPLAMNAKAAVTALWKASEKTERTASLTFSEAFWHTHAPLIVCGLAC
ncbi:hypothetical protein BUALT_Bualt14G0055400 [Buddleja alternifolia]|uniref:EF-hand domain-containing protein n=1 Tax=Buddleja alternifolia TaxID=168488 RepID=A0AAV6WGH4_9LAMI|nr:hypothetical protein BUALT_Bualt14G0055400 [Buddleja alternifolia]